MKDRNGIMPMEVMSMARILALGSPDWTNGQTTSSALRKVMRIYRDPYVLVCNMADGAPRYAAAAAETLGWLVEPHHLDPAKCGPDCPPADGHRKAGGPTGTYCTSALGRNVEAMLDTGVDLCVAFLYKAGRRVGQHQASRRDIGVWTYIQPARTGKRA